MAGLRRQAAGARPVECCGALIGLLEYDTAVVRQIRPARNRAHGTDRYLIPGDVVQRIEQQALAAGLRVLGFYHSHPAGGTEPSDLDRELAWPGYVYVVVCGDTCALRAWRLREDRSGFDELVIARLAGAA